MGILYFILCAVFAFLSYEKYGWIKSSYGSRIDFFVYSSACVFFGYQFILQLQILV